MHYNTALETVQDCQAICFDYRLTFKDADYLEINNHLQHIYSFIQHTHIQRRSRDNRVFAYFRTRPNENMSSAECMLFLLNTIKGILWFYTIGLCLTILYIILIARYDNDKQQRHLHLKTVRLRQ